MNLRRARERADADKYKLAPAWCRMRVPCEEYEQTARSIALDIWLLRPEATSCRGKGRRVTERQERRASERLMNAAYQAVPETRQAALNDWRRILHEGEEDITFNVHVLVRRPLGEVGLYRCARRLDERTITECASIVVVHDLRVRADSECGNAPLVTAHFIALHDDALAINHSYSHFILFSFQQ